MILAALQLGPILLMILAGYTLHEIGNLLIPSKESKLQKKALQLQGRGAAAQASVRHLLAGTERLAQDQEIKSKVVDDRALSHLLAAIGNQSQHPAEEEELHTLRATGDTLEATSAGMERGGDPDVEGMLAALQSLQEKTSSPTGEEGMLQRLIGASSA